MDRFIHLPEFRVIICKECEYVVLPSHINTYFVGEPYKLEVSERRKITEEVAEVNRLITNEEVLRQTDFPFPVPTSKPIEGLAAPKRGMLQCMFEDIRGVCRYICKTTGRMRAHCREEHGQKGTRRGRRPKKHVRDLINSAPWRTNVSCQRFFIQGPKLNYRINWHISPPYVARAAEMRAF